MLLKFCALISAALIIFAPQKSSAENSILHWHSTNIQILHGSGFELSKNKTQQTITLEHANGWALGDNFFYIDAVIGEPDETNAEFSPRLSFSKMTGYDFSAGPISDILLSGTWEKARRFDAYLYGIGIDLNVPGFSFVQTNWYVRDDPDTPDRGWQTTWVWSLPFEIEAQKLTFDGYFDFANYEGGASNFFTQPQLLWDIGHAFNGRDGKLYAGIEYRYWHNKFGVEGVDETAPQVMLKYNF